MSVVTLEAKMTNSRPITTWLAALGLSRFQSPTICYELPMYMMPSPMKPMMAAMVNASARHPEYH